MAIGAFLSTLVALAPETIAATEAITAAGTVSTAAAAGTVGTVGANIAAIGTVAGVGSSAGQGVSSVKAARFQEKAAALGRRKAQISATRERRRIVREAQRARAVTVAQAEAQGVEGGSTARIGAVQGIESQLASNISFLERQTQAGLQGSRFLGEAARATTRAGLFKTGFGISNLFLREEQRG